VTLGVRKSGEAARNAEPYEAFNGSSVWYTLKAFEQSMKHWQVMPRVCERTETFAPVIVPGLRI